MSLENYGTIWVCSNCLYHHTNDECGDCHSDHGHDEEPLSAIENCFHVSMGMIWEDHDDECLLHIINDLRENYPDMVWPDVPEDYDCNCEYNHFSLTQCEGCGTYLHGERHGMTLFKN